MPFFSTTGLKLIQVSEAQILSSQYVFLPEESHSLLQNILTLGSEMRMEQLVGASCFIKKNHMRELTAAGGKYFSRFKIKSKQIKLLLECFESMLYYIV